MEEIFNNPKYALKSTFMKEAIKQGFTKTQIQHFLATSEATQINKQRKGPIAFYPILRPPFSYQADLMFIEGTPLLCMINCNSRYAYVDLINNSKSAVNVSKALEKMFKEAHPFELQTDNGKEFKNSNVENLCNTYGIQHHMVDPGDHRGQGMIERFNETMRGIINQWETRGGNWKKDLQDLVFSYNHKVNRVTLEEPAEADDLSGVYSRSIQYGRARAKDNLKIGDTVRKLIQKNTFDKGKDRYTQETYQIVGRSGNGWNLSDGSHKLYYELQYIKGVSATIPINIEKKREEVKKVATVERRTRKEGLESIVKPGKKDIVPIAVERKKKEKIIFDASLVGRYVLRKGVRGSQG